MSKHHLTGADEIYFGSAYSAVAYGTNGRRGIPISGITIWGLTDPVALDADGLAEAQAVAGAGNLTLDGALIAGGTYTGQSGIARCVQIVSDNVGDTTQTATVTGTDMYDVDVVETMTFNGTTPVLGAKALKTVSQITISAAMTGNASAGTTDKFGLPYKISNQAHFLQHWAIGTEERSSLSVTVGDETNPATATTNDVRGTTTLNTAANGSRDYVSLLIVDDPGNAFGVAQYAG